MPEVEPRNASHNNSFGLWRLIFASLVIVQHSLALTGHESDAVLGFFRPTSIGEIAVAGFFGLSGFLLFGSVTRHSSIRFAVLRFFRLFPGYWGALILVAFVFAPVIALGSASWSDYHVTGSNSASTYVLYNSALIVVQHGIGNLLATVPYPTALNGSLWSLAPEFLCYVGLLAVGMLMRRNPANMRYLLIAIVGLAAIILAAARPLLGDTAGEVPALLAALSLAFFSGSLIACTGLLRDPSARTGLMFAGATVCAIAFGLWAPLGPPLLAATAIALGSRVKSGLPARIGQNADLSYGIYLYHFPVIQTVIALGLTGTSVGWALWWLCPLVFFITLPIAGLSWYGVERPAQNLGRRLRLGQSQS
jgi:peptidoglycan/LPS O-acetylase OafA/YrhL